ncbi:MAG TPA: hypothetical protein VIN77_02380 [Aurantimonas sp.]
MAGTFGVSALGGTAPGLSSRQTAAMKQKPLNRMSTVPIAIASQSGKMFVSKVRAPTPEASAANPDRTQAA